MAGSLKNRRPSEDLITLADLEASPTLLQSNLDVLADWSAMMSSEETLKNLPSTVNSEPEYDETMLRPSEIQPSAPSTSAVRNNENAENINVQVLEAEDDTDFSSDNSVQDLNFQLNGDSEVFKKLYSNERSYPENYDPITQDSEFAPSVPSNSAMSNNEINETLNLQVLETEDDTDFSSDDSVQDPNFQPNEDPEILREISNHQRKRAKRGRSDKRQWTYEQQKNKRMKGEGYLGRRKNEEGKIVYNAMFKRCQKK